MGDCSPQTQAATTFKLPTKEYEGNKQTKPNQKRRPMDSYILSEEICSEKKKVKSNQCKDKQSSEEESRPRIENMMENLIKIRTGVWDLKCVCVHHE